MMDSTYTKTAFSLLVFAASFVVFFIMAMPLLAGPDMPWHIMAGRYILEHGAIPETNLWSFTAPDQIWYLLSWGWNLVLGVLDAAFGVRGIFIASQFLMAALVATLIWQVQKRDGIGSEALLLTTLLAVLSMLEFAGARPQLAGYMFVLFFMWVLHRSRTAPSVLMLYALPLTMLVWVNMHGSFIAGVTLLGAYAVEALISKRGRWFRHICITSLLCLAVFPLNPYGFSVIDGVLGTLASSGLAEITEWKHFTFGQSIGISAWAAVFGIGMIYRSRSVPLADLILSVMWCAAMLWSVRNAAIFVLVSAPMMALNLQSVLARFDHIRTHHPDPLTFLNKPAMPVKMLLLAVMAVVSCAVLLDKQPKKDMGAAISYLQKELPGARILNDYDYGGRIIYETHGTHNVFVDSRLGTAYPDSIIADYVRFLLQEDGWEEAITRYDIEGIFISNASRFAKAYKEGARPQWQEVYRNDTAGIYVRK